MTSNISKLNRVTRLTIGLILIAVAIFGFSALNIWMLGLGIIMSVTGLIGICPISHYIHMKQLP